MMIPLIKRSIREGEELLPAIAAAKTLEAQQTCDRDIRDWVSSVRFRLNLPNSSWPDIEAIDWHNRSRQAIRRFLERELQAWLDQLSRRE